MKNLKKLVVMLIILMVGILTASTSQAFNVFADQKASILKDGKFYPNTALPGGTFFCIQPGGEFHPNITEYGYANYKNNYKTIPSSGNYVCEECNGELKTPWNNNTYYYYKYELEGEINALEHQDAAYALAEACERGILMSWDTAYAIWESSISDPKRIGGYDLIKEAQAYWKFYKLTHSGTTDIFETLIKDRSSNIKVGVDQTGGYYVVGPFKVTYPDGVYNGKNRFSWVEKVEAVTDTGTYPAEVLEYSDFGKEGSTSLNGKEFYIKFYSNTATNVSLKVKFGYLESCSATMKKYVGKRMNCNWTLQTSGKCDHSYNDPWDASKNDSNGNGIQDNGEVGDWHEWKVDKKRYEAKEEEGSATQRLMALEGQASKNYKYVEKVLPLQPIPLTIDIGGNVFLDKDEGKVNEGNNVFDDGEGLKGVEVYLYEASGNAASGQYEEKHVHSGSSSSGTGCYTTPIYHKHEGNVTEAVYHTHTLECYKHDDAGNVIDASGKILYDKNRNFVQNGTPIIICGKEERKTIDYYKNTCAGKVTYSTSYFTCTKTEGKTIDGYALGCNKIEGQTVEGRKEVKNKTITGDNGYYEFKNLNAMKKYYVEFVYNGMLYTNVLPFTGDNAEKQSKATEAAVSSTNRQAFNDKFKEIGSNPNNYMSPSRGAYNQVFLQEDIADTFKTIASNYGSHGNTDKEVFAFDCRIRARSVKNYPVLDKFAISESNETLGGETFPALYAGADNPKHINLGIKARQTFDLALYKDVFNAKLNINGQEEVYTYDARKDWQNEGFSYGVREDYYLEELRNKYIEGKDTNITTTEVASEGEYSHEYRTEEIINGNNVNENYQSWLKDNNYLNTLYGEDSNKQYAWRDINHGITDKDKLQIHVTYKIAIRNQSSVVGSVTEIVDYYDSHYQFEKAYVGDKDGKEIANTKVDASETSMYGEATRMGANGQWTVGSEKRGYKTIYLRPTEKKLYTDDKEQYIYVTFGLINPESTLIAAGLPQGKRFYTYNLAEINGYKTYGTDIKDTNSLGLIDRDSNPGNFNPATYEMGKTALEDDTSKAPAYAYSIRTSRTLEGNVFEDALSKDATASKEKYVVNVAKTRFGNGTIDSSDKKIEGVKVELVEIKNGQLVVRQTTYTDKDGWYGFGAFLPGDYTIRFTYGAEDKTALTTTSQYTQGLNATSYNGQDYQSTTFTTKQGETVTPHNYKVDATLQSIYNASNAAKNSEEKDVTVADQVIKKYDIEGYYWFDDPYMANKSDAEDDAARRAQVVAYSKTEYGKEITNHKAEVFNSYINQKTLREQESKDDKFDKFTQAQPMEEVVDTEAKNRELVNELERRTYMYAYTPEIKVEVEYTTKQIEGNMNAKKAADDKKDYYEYKITGVDFGVVERPRTQLTIDQDIDHIKVTAADGTTLLELQHEETGDNFKVVVNNGDNYMYAPKSDFSKYDKEELLNVILDDELLSGAKLEVTYNITVTNNSEANTGTTRAKTIINYVANNLNFDLSDNNGLWEVVKKEDIQTTSHSTFINNASRNKDVKLVDLSTQTTVLKATNANPLTKVLNPGESTTSTLTLKKTLSAESSVDDLSYSEIIEIDNTVGRYDHGAIPGNQSLEEQPREHDTSGASRYDEIDQTSGTKNVKTRYPQDGKIIVTPPTGSKIIYYVLGITLAVILATGIILIKKFVIRKK